jgi:hypothetical protein
MLHKCAGRASIYLTNFMEPMPMAATYSEKIAQQLVGYAPSHEIDVHMWSEVERIAHGFAGPENDYGVRLYSAICDHKAEVSAARRAARLS